MAHMIWLATTRCWSALRRQAQEHGRSLNEWVTAVLSAASEPSSAGDEAQQLGETLARAGLLEDVGPPVARPDSARVAAARAAAGRGTPLADFVSSGR